MDTTITAAPTEEAGTTVTSAPEPQTAGVGSGTETGQDTTGQSDASSPQGGTEDTQPGQNQRRPQWTKQDEIRELRQQRREYRQEMQNLRAELEELREWREQQTRQPKNGKADRNPAEFWQDPEARLESLMEEKLARLEEGLTGRFFQSREEFEAAQNLRQEQQAGVEFIRSQDGYHPDDDEDLVEIIENYGLARLGPMQAAEVAWIKLQQMRGVGDRTVQKRRASGAQGQAPAAGMAGKIWSKAEFDSAVDMLEKQGVKADQKLLDELMTAHKEGRVR